MTMVGVLIELLVPSRRMSLELKLAELAPTNSEVAAVIELAVASRVVALTEAVMLPTRRVPTPAVKVASADMSNVVAAPVDTWKLPMLNTSSSPLPETAMLPLFTEWAYAVALEPTLCLPPAATVTLRLPAALSASGMTSAWVLALLTARLPVTVMAVVPLMTYAAAVALNVMAPSEVSVAMSWVRLVVPAALSNVSRSAFTGAWAGDQLAGVAQLALPPSAHVSGVAWAVAVAYNRNAPARPRLKSGEWYMWVGRSMKVVVGCT